MARRSPRLLRRIGQPPLEKALEMARQLCAALAAAHDHGVVHRDLKPANIMVDGRGQMRVLDFGLAVPAAEAVGEVAGTPAYMAPEQRAGEPATIRSDLFSLGRVLSELLPAGRDPRTAAAIEACLQPAPEMRPPSARSVLAALPPGPAHTSYDGAIPTPAMVAAAPMSGALTPLPAWALLAVAIAGCLAVASQAFVFHVAPVDVPKPPEVLAERAREILVERGQAGPVADRAFWWWADDATGQIVAQTVTTLPLTLDTDAWYFGRSLVVLVLLSTLAIYGFVVSLGGRPAFGEMTKTPT